MDNALKRLSLPAFALGAALLLTPLPALAAANGNASCNGLGSSAIGPLGQRDDAARTVKAAADAAGIPPGQIYSSAAHQHLGSAEACLAIP